MIIRSIIRILYRLPIKQPVFLECQEVFFFSWPSCPSLQAFTSLVFLTLVGILLGGCWKNRVFSQGFFNDRSSDDTLGGGNSNILLFSPLFGEDSHFDSYFASGLVQPPASTCFINCSRKKNHVIPGSAMDDITGNTFTITNGGQPIRKFRTKLRADVTFGA